MGPGYFPTIVSTLILLLGVGVGLRSPRRRGTAVERPQLRPIFCVIAAILMFGWLIDRVGLAITAVALTLIAAYARRQVNLKETLALGVGMALFTILVFVYALGQPLPAWWGR